MDPSFVSNMGALDFGLFAAGCVAGWGFAQRTAVKLANDRIAEIRAEHDAERKASKERIAALEARIQHLEDQRYQDAREDAGKPNMDAKLARLVSRLREDGE